MNTKEILETLKDGPELYELIKGYTELKDQESKALIKNYFNHCNR